MRILPFLIITLICGYLYVNWMEIPNPFSFSNVILGFVLKPVQVFAATITFIIGFIANGIFIRETVKSIKRNNSNIVLPLILIGMYLTSIYYLSLIGFWQIVLFFSFAFVYGMMTIDKNK